MPDPADVAAAPGTGPRLGKPTGRRLRTGRTRQLVAIGEFADATGLKPGIVVYYSPWNEKFSTSFGQTAGATVPMCSSSFSRMA